MMKLKDITSSQLRHVIEIISHTTRVDKDCLPIKEEEVITKVRARIDVVSLKRQETLVAQGINVSKSLLFVLRHIPNLDSEIHKIRYKNRIYNIEGIEDVEERGLFLNVLGEEKR